MVGKLRVKTVDQTGGSDNDSRKIKELTIIKTSKITSEQALSLAKRTEAKYSLKAIIQNMKETSLCYD